MKATKSSGPAESIDRTLGHDEMSRVGLPKSAELVAFYGERAGLDVSQDPGYEAFAYGKNAVVAQRLNLRWTPIDSTDEQMPTASDGIRSHIALASGLFEQLPA